VAEPRAIIVGANPFKVIGNGLFEGFFAPCFGGVKKILRLGQASSIDFNSGEKSGK
jgi:hypothetical protein